MAALAAGAPLSAAPASDYPSRPIKLVVPHGPGGVADIVSRIFADYLGRELGQTVVVENKAGASTMIGAEYVAKAPADGYTLLMASVTTLSINPSIYPNITYDPERDFSPVSMVASLPFYLIVSPTLKVQNVHDLIALARAQPGKLNYSSPGSGTSPHLVGALFASIANIDVVHVPYKTTSSAEVDINAGRIHFAFTGSGMPAIKANRVRGIGITSAERTSAMPELPTLMEQGLAVDASVWNGIVAPAGTPQPVIDKLATALAKIARMKEVREKVGNHSGITVGNTPQEFKLLIKSEAQRWAKVVRESGAKVE